MKAIEISKSFKNPLPPRGFLARLKGRVFFGEITKGQIGFLMAGKSSNFCLQAHKSLFKNRPIVNV